MYLLWVHLMSVFSMSGLFGSQNHSKEMAFLGCSWHAVFLLTLDMFLFFLPRVLGHNDSFASSSTHSSGLISCF